VTASESASEIIEDLFRAALGAAEPAAAIHEHVRRNERELMVDGRIVPVWGRLIVVGAGKAAVRMALGVEAICGDLIDGGLVITKEGHAVGELPSRIAVREASHPIPDERGVSATRELLNLVNGAGPDDVVLAIISGGGSALLEAPRPPVTLEDMARVTDLLLRTGAPIQDLNAVRIPLSLVKGGGLRRAAGQATVVTLILSDVLGNDPTIIASGPTVSRSATGNDAMGVLRRYGLLDDVPAAVREALAGSVQEEPVDVSGDLLVIVADNAAAVAAAEKRALQRGLSTRIEWSAATGEASDLGRNWAERCRVAPRNVELLLGGGEATVTVRGEGIGGRNTELTLAAALALDAIGLPDWTVASLATDGDDGMTRAAGAIASAEAIARARSLGIDPALALRENDSGRFFEAVGGLVRPGPTGTNVNDLYVAIRRY
jgi:hydroxypyruvate reductase